MYAFWGMQLLLSGLCNSLQTKNWHEHVCIPKRVDTQKGIGYAKKSACTHCPYAKLELHIVGQSVLREETYSAGTLQQKKTVFISPAKFVSETEMNR